VDDHVVALVPPGAGTIGHEGPGALVGLAAQGKAQRQVALDGHTGEGARRRPGIVDQVHDQPLTLAARHYFHVAQSAFQPDAAPGVFIHDVHEQPHILGRGVGEAHLGKGAGQVKAASLAIAVQDDGRALRRGERGIAAGHHAVELGQHLRTVAGLDVEAPGGRGVQGQVEPGQERLGLGGGLPGQRDIVPVLIVDGPGPHGGPQDVREPEIGAALAVGGVERRVKGGHHRPAVGHIPPDRGDGAIGEAGAGGQIDDVVGLQVAVAQLQVGDDIEGDARAGEGVAEAVEGVGEIADKGAAALLAAIEVGDLGGAAIGAVGVDGVHDRHLGGGDALVVVGLVPGHQAHDIAGGLAAGGVHVGHRVVRAVPEAGGVGGDGGDAELGLHGGVHVPAPGLLIGGHKDNPRLVRGDGLEHLGSDAGLPEVSVLGRRVEHKAALRADDVVILHRRFEIDIRRARVGGGEVHVIDAVGVAGLEALVALHQELVLAAPIKVPGILGGQQVAAIPFAEACLAALAIAAAAHHDGTVQKDAVDVVGGEVVQEGEKVVAPGAVDAAGISGVVELGQAAVAGVLQPVRVILEGRGGERVHVDVEDQADAGGVGALGIGGEDGAVGGGTKAALVQAPEKVRALLDVKAHLGPEVHHLQRFVGIGDALQRRDAHGPLIPGFRHVSSLLVHDVQLALNSDQS